VLVSFPAVGSGGEPGPDPYALTREDAFSRALPEGACDTQIADPNYVPTVPNPSYAPSTGPKVAVDTTHDNFHSIDGRYRPFADLLAADGYLVEAWTEPFIDPSCGQALDDWRTSRRC
jgi:hypothetical protein